MEQGLRAPGTLCFLRGLLDLAADPDGYIEPVMQENERRLRERDLRAAVAEARGDAPIVFDDQFESRQRSRRPEFG